MDEDADGNGTAPETEERSDGPAVDPGTVDERIRRLEAIVRALETGEVDREERATRIAEGRALVAALERDLEAVEREATDDGSE